MCFVKNSKVIRIKYNLVFYHVICTTKYWCVDKEFINDGINLNSTPKNLYYFYMKVFYGINPLYLFLFLLRQLWVSVLNYSREFFS